jgi:predicted amidohydrolase
MEQKEVKISILQMSSILGDVEANISKVDKLIQDNLPNNSDVLVLPEVWTVGWACRFFQNSAQDLYKGSVSEFLSSTAKKYNINIIGGSFITKQCGNYYNTCPVFDRAGHLITSYNKNHLYSYYGCDEGTYITRGDNGTMVNLDGVNYGLTICYDIRFPELYRAYMKSGADVLVNCAAWGAKKFLVWEIMTKSRAIENQCYMVALTQSGHIENDEYNLGQSRIIDFKGEEVTSIMSGEGIATGTLLLNEMYNFRAKAPTLNDIKEKYEVKIPCEKY